MSQQRKLPAEYSPEEIGEYCESVRRTWVRRTGDGMLAEDLAQETALVALERLHRAPLDSPDKLGAYMHQTAKNLYVAHQRKLARRRTGPGDVDIFHDDSANPERLHLIAERQSLLLRLLRSLKTKRDRDILTRAVVQCHDKADICSSLGLSAVHFDRVLARAKRRLVQTARRALIAD